MRFATILALASLYLWPGLPLKSQDTAKAIVEQAQPVLTWLRAVKDGDQDRLKTVFSQALRRQFDREGWATVLMAYQDAFSRQFGDYELEDFAFEYTGGTDRGHVIVVHDGRRMPGLRVTREGTEWKIDER